MANSSSSSHYCDDDDDDDEFSAPRQVRDAQVSANAEMVSRCLPPRAIALERLAQGRTHELISVLYTHVFPRPMYTYMSLDLIRMQSGVL